MKDTEIEKLKNFFIGEVNISLPMYAQMEDDEAVVEGDIWNGVRIDRSRSSSVPRINLVRQSIQVIAGMWAQSAGEASVLPAKGGEGEDGKAARADAIIKNYIMRHHERASGAKFQVRQAVMQAASCGISWLHDFHHRVTDENDETATEIVKSFLDWRFCVWDSGFQKPDFSDGRYFFHRWFLDLDVAKKMYPRSVREIEAARRGWQPWRLLYEDLGAGTGLAFSRNSRGNLYSPYGGAAGDGYFDGFEGEHSDLAAGFPGGERQGVWVIRAYWRDISPDEQNDAVRRQVFYRDFVVGGGDWQPLSKKEPWHFIPYTPLIYGRDPSTGWPRGLTNDLKDPARHFNAAVEQMLSASQSQTVVAEKSAVAPMFTDIPTGSVEEQLAMLTKYTSGPQKMVIVGDGTIDQIRIDSNEAKFNQAGNVANLLMSVLQNGVNSLNSATLGNESGAQSGVAIGRQQSQGVTSVRDFMENVHLAVRFSGEKSLALIENYGDMPEYFRVESMLSGNSVIDARDVMKKGGVSPEMYSLRAMRAQYSVVSAPASSAEVEKFINVLMEISKQMGGMGALFYPLIIRMMPNLPQGLEFSQLAAKVLTQQGLPLGDFVAPDDQEEMQQAAQQQSAKAEEAEQMQKAGFAAEIDKTAADAELSRAKAQEAGAGILQGEAQTQIKAAEAGAKMAAASSQGAETRDMETLAAENAELKGQLAQWWSKFRGRPQ